MQRAAVAGIRFCCQLQEDIEETASNVCQAMERQGTQLKKLLEFFFQVPTRSCKCQSRADHMNAMGNDWCEEEHRHNRRLAC
jgi:hypothetical protein